MKISPPPFLNKVVAVFFSLESMPIYVAVLLLIKQEAPKKQHCARGGTRQTPLKQVHDKSGIEESLHVYINRARLTACEVGIFSREISLLKICPPPSLSFERVSWIM